MNGDSGLQTGNDCDTALFDALYQEHHRVLYAYLVGQISQSDRAADLLQETFLRVWRHIGDARSVPSERQRYWLLALARSVTIDDRRRHAVRQHLEGELPENLALIADSHSDPAEAIHRKESAQEVDAAIRRLPHDLRTALTMSLLGGMTSKEIGEALGVASGTVRYRIAQARTRLAQDLGLERTSGRARKESCHEA